MKITYYVHDLSFPLVEGIRKQAWWMAREMHKLGFKVEIVSTGKKKKTVIREEIKIKYGNPFQISKIKTDVLHYLSHPTPLIVPLLLRAKAHKKIMTIYGGYLHSFWKRKWDFFVGHLVKKKINLITLQTKFQQRLLEKTQLKNMKTLMISPLIPKLKKSGGKSKHPTLLFMSHLSKIKGIEETLSAFMIAKNKVPDLRLLVCNSGLNKSKENDYYLQKIRNINKRFNEQAVIVKGKVNPENELSNSWIYLYPIRSAKETFSVPLSFVEAIQVKTPFIGTNVGGINEYFKEDYLVKPKNYEALAKKIVSIIKNYNKIKIKKQLKLKQKIVNKEIIKKWEKIYLN